VGRASVCYVRALALTLLFLSGCALNDPTQNVIESPDAGCAEERNALDAQLHDDPDNVGTLNARATTYVCTKQYDLALADLNRAIQLKPKAFEFDKRAAVYAREHDLKDAIADLDEASRIEPENPTPYLVKARFYDQIGNADLSLANLSKALDLANSDRDVSNYDVFNSYAWIRATSSTPKVLDGSAALKYAISACQLTHWENPNYLDTLAAAYAANGQFGEAVKWQKEAIDRSIISSQTDQMKTRLTLYENKRSYRVPALLSARSRSDSSGF
jgi:tetratricopeptide (TPR) repeat protein